MRYCSENVMDPVRYGTSLNTTKKHNLHWRDFLRHYAGPLPKSYHLWPDNPPTYKKGLGLDPDYIESSLGDEGTQMIASNYYPACPEPNKTLGLAPHSDHGGLIILMDNGIPGLQIKCNQTWYSVPSIPGTFVVNLGDYLEILSNGKYKSIEHRGVGHGPAMDAIVQPASPLIKERVKVHFGPLFTRTILKPNKLLLREGRVRCMR
ncbi:hypothetical protein H5410_038232 [Solanum commersonii]|uniref:Fe2OG dioxygenase domain-containing protein n=1 Tax=Solanum commersonii TaxID=4109 RepID=A0A9J5YBR7_SOLCO|nr:hypothetical protein H5410_038232 [Solanum commersonii]